MRASELIAALAKLITENGDLHIRIPIHDEEETDLYSYILHVEIQTFQRDQPINSPNGIDFDSDIWRLNPTGETSILIN